MAAAMNGMALHGGIIPYQRHLPGVLRLLPAGDPPCRADGHARHPCHDPRLRSGSAKTDRRISRSSISRRCARSRICACSARPTRSRRVECWQLALEQHGWPERAGADAPESAAAAQDGRDENRCAAAPMSLSPATAARRSRSSPPARRWRLRSRRASCSTESGIAARVVSVPCFELLFEQPEAVRRPSSATRPSRSASRRRPPGLGRASSAPTAFSSACRLRRQRALQGTLPAFRHHGRGIAVRQARLRMITAMPAAIISRAFGIESLMPCTG